MAACVLGLAATLARAADHTPQTASPADAWMESVRLHQPGRADASLDAVAAMPLKQIEKQLARLRELEIPLLVRALVLHTDLAIIQRDGIEATDGRGSGVLLTDGREAGRQTRSPHWAIASRIAGALADRRDAAADHAAKAWFHAVAAMLQEWGDLTLLHGHLNEAIRRWPDDAWFHVYRGTLHQAYADRRVQQYVRDATNQPRPPARPLFSGGRYPAQATIRRGAMNPIGPSGLDDELRVAEADLRRAVALDPRLAEARIRLAHVLSDRDQTAEAADLATSALATELSPFFEIYASLILGRSAIRLGRLEDARLAFERAAARSPMSQSPRVGLAQVALAQGRSSEALDSLTVVAGPDHGPQFDDEWTLYFRLHVPDAAQLVAALRSEVR